MNWIMGALPVVVIPLVAWLLWDIGRQQAKREAERLARIAAARDAYVIRWTFTVDTYPFVKAMRQVTEAINKINENPELRRLIEKHKELAAKEAAE